MYACGGVIGVFCALSPFMASIFADCGSGLGLISDGNVGDLDVFNGARIGFGCGGMVGKAAQVQLSGQQPCRLGRERRKRLATKPIAGGILRT
jgi:hypothetical protein